MERNKLGSFGSLFKKSVADFRSRFKTVLSFIVIFLGLNLITSIGSLLGASHSLALGMIVYVIGAVVCMPAIFILNNALLYSMKDGAELKESLRFSLKSLWSLSWISIATAAAVFSGLVALIIPGIIIFLFFIFSIIVFMDDGTKGIGALVKSKNYIKGYFSPVAGRIIILGLITAGVLLVVSIISSIPIIGGLIAIAVNALLAPIIFCFLWNLFRDLKSKNSEAGAHSDKKGWIKTLVVVGLVLLPAIIAFLVVGLILVLVGGMATI